MIESSGVTPNMISYDTGNQIGERGWLINYRRECTVVLSSAKNHATSFAFSPLVQGGGVSTGAELVMGSPFQWALFAHCSFWAVTAWNHVSPVWPAPMDCGGNRKNLRILYSGVPYYGNTRSPLLHLLYSSTMLDQQIQLLQKLMMGASPKLHYQIQTCLISTWFMRFD